MLVFTSDKKRLKEFFHKDPVLFAYHLGDLDDFYFPHCQWAVTYGYLPYIEECILLYTGIATPTLLAFGLSDKFPDLLREMLDILPLKFYCHYQQPSETVLASQYQLEPLGRHLKMRVGSFQPVHEDKDSHNIVRLNPSDSRQLQQLYDRSYPGHYFTDRMLESGKYLGIVEDSNLVAVAGVHVDSAEYRIAVLGNITTHPDYRGRGLATLLTSRLTEELLGERKLVCLNVKTDNEPAIACYRSLGFKAVHEYDEAFCQTPEKL